MLIAGVYNNKGEHRLLRQTTRPTTRPFLTDRLTKHRLPNNLSNFMKSDRIVEASPSGILRIRLSHEQDGAMLSNKVGTNKHGIIGDFISKSISDGGEAFIELKIKCVHSLDFSREDDDRFFIQINFNPFESNTDEKNMFAFYVYVRLEGHDEYKRCKLEAFLNQFVGKGLSKMKDVLKETREEL